MQQISKEGVQGETQLRGQGDSLGNVQEISIWPCQQIVYAPPSTCPRKWHTQTPMGLWHTNGSPNLGQKTKPYNNQKKKKKKKEKKTCKIVDFAVPDNHRIKLEECEKRDKYLDLARILKKLWNMKVTIIISTFGTVTGGFGIRRPNGNHPNKSIIENGQNTEKNPGNLRRLAVTQTPVKDHQLMLMWKTLITIVMIIGKGIHWELCKKFKRTNGICTTGSPS